MFIFLTPKQVQDLNIGYQVPEGQNPDTIRPWELSNLLTQAQKYYGVSQKNPFQNDLEENKSKGVIASIVLEFPHKVCRINENELNLYGLKYGLLKLNNSVDVFNRLLTSGEISKEDLSIAGADSNLMNKLDHRSQTSIDDFYSQISLFLSDQVEDERFKEYFDQFAGSDELNFWLYGVD